MCIWPKRITFILSFHTFEILLLSFRLAFSINKVNRKFLHITWLYLIFDSILIVVTLRHKILCIVWKQYKYLWRMEKIVEFLLTPKRNTYKLVSIFVINLSCCLMFAPSIFLSNTEESRYTCLYRGLLCLCVHIKHRMLCYS